MRSEDEVSRRFEELRFPGEPPMASQPTDDVERGTRRLRRRRAMVLVPALAAVTTAVIGVAFAFPPNSGAERDVQVADGPASPKPEPPKPKPEPTVRPAPPASDLTEPELAEALRSCTKDAPEWQAFEPALGVRFDTEQRLPNTFVVAHQGDDKLACDLLPSGHYNGAGVFGNSAAKDIPYLFTLVDEVRNGIGRYTRPVAKVTLRPEDGPEQEAVLRDGYWFFPMDDSIDFPFPPHEKFKGDPEKLRKLSERYDTDYRIRGYDENGELVYDSKRDKPSSNCFTDPSGTEVVSGDLDADPSTCDRTYEWKP